MRAAVFREMSKPLVSKALPDPVPGPTDIILKVNNCGICGSDLHMTEPLSIMPLALGTVMGHEFAGEVVDVGSAVTTSGKAAIALRVFRYICCGEVSPCLNFGVGREMCGKGISVGLGQSHGAYAEFVKIGASGALSAARQRFVPRRRDGRATGCGLHAVDKAKMARGATVLVVGAGPVGLP